MNKLFPVLALFFVLFFPLYGKDKMSLKLIEEYPLKRFPEPSGLCYSESRNTLFLVGDEGHVAEISLEGEILNLTWLGNRDLEGICWDGESETLYALDEKMSQIFTLNPDSLEIQEIETLAFHSKGPFEGLSLDDGGQFILVNQKLKKDAKKASFILHRGDELLEIKTGIEDQSGVSFQGDFIYIISDRHNRLYTLDLDGEELWNCKLPGRTQEGIAVDADGFLYIAQDSGGLLKLKLLF